MAKRSTITDPMPGSEVRQQGIAFWLVLLLVAVVAMGAFSFIGTAHLRMIETESGLRYQVLREGEGETPGPNDQVLVHYEGSLEDGTVFDSSYQRGSPSVFGVSQVIPGWTEGLQLMKPGSRYRFQVPSDLAYGAEGAADGYIPPNSDLTFDVELLDVGQAGPRG
ncbi:peptidylprolyl isomerase [Pacificimonas flava]|uniref:Peptidyl-prolyl cis-trans isomerase n=2 Tax=Pacificimonas TaxID=1960290 RepID=A0A219B5A6_9SPHN|nr:MULTISPECIES: FKBP-type peptidyl-prolyl cis-trans isomerase [Pacificimonas]MBZ6379262.1 FKBP-type peptidyl-prolyl cis-trans isomerase [Pacificimonas aurantium]OWV33527.1 peptidylprolyl isomerase [Pacificimonas flava]